MLQRCLTQEFSRYFFAGCLAFGADLCVLVGLAELAGVHYLVANVFGFCAGLTVSYLLCIRWVFERRRLANVSHEILIFFLLTLAGLAANEVLMWIIVEQGEVHYVIAKVVATGSVFALNFIMKRSVLFR